MPHISVIMPVYNRTVFVDEAIESILNQTCSDFELIIISDPSPTGESEKLMDSYAEKDSRIIHICNSEKLGACACRNIGFQKARGEFWATMDSDDLSGLRRLEVQLAHMEMYPKIGLFGIRPGLLGNNTWFVDMRSSPEQVKAMLLFFAPVRHPTFFGRLDWFLENKLFYDEQLTGMEDIELMQRVSFAFPLSNISDPTLFSYRLHSENAGKTQQQDDTIIRHRLQKNYFQKSLDLNFSDEDCRILVPFAGIRKYPREKKAKGLQRLEELLKIIYNKNLHMKTFDKEALSIILNSIWTKQMIWLAKDHKGFAQVPSTLRKIYESSVFNTARVYGTL